MTTPEWYSHNLRRLFFDMHLPDWTQPGQSGGDQHELRGIATNFDPDHLVAEFVRARINTAVIFAKCQFGNFYYNTKIGHKHVGLGDLDLLGEVLERAHRHGIRVIGYYSNMWDTEAARLHPDWMAEEADGSYSYNRWPTMSLLSPYRDLVHEHLREMFTNYDLDGVWSDILSDLPSFDKYSRECFKQDTGLAPLILFVSSPLRSRVPLVRVRRFRSVSGGARRRDFGSAAPTDAPLVPISSRPCSPRPCVGVWFERSLGGALRPGGTRYRFAAMGMRLSAPGGFSGRWDSTHRPAIRRQAYDAVRRSVTSTCR